MVGTGPAFVTHRDVAYAFLPPGEHRFSVQQVHDRFVTGHSNASHRLALFEKWVALRTTLQQFLPIEREYLDGSFVTDKPRPKDTDVIFEILEADLQALHGQPMRSAAFVQFWNLRMNAYSCDAYIIPIVAKTSPIYAATVTKRNDMKRYWRTTRNHDWEPLVNGPAKGYVQVMP